MKYNRLIALILVLVMLVGALSSCQKIPLLSDSESGKGNQGLEKNESLALHYSLDESSGSLAKESVSGKDYTINYVFNEENADNLFKEPNDPLRRQGVKGNALYMDGFSNNIVNRDFVTPSSAITMSAWVAPRVFENIVYYDGASDAAGHTRMTSILNKGDIEMCEGFLLGYGRLGLWGIQLALHSEETGEDFVIGFYDPINALPLYEWSHVAVVFDGNSGYIGLFYNGEKAYEALIPELVATRIIHTEEPLRVGAYVSPQIEFGIRRQMISGLLDEVQIYSSALTPKDITAIYNDTDTTEAHPYLDWKDIALDPSVYEGDRYRPQYHAIPPAVWMNEPHSPFYYKGMYHVFYQHNPAGPYWSQIRWAHIVSKDMVHWEYVKDAVVPTAGICPEGIWTGGACIGPDGTPWLAITAGTNLYGNPNHGGQNVAFAHAKDPNDPYLVEWVVEDKLVITQPNDNTQGEREQFRDPFVWYDDGTYYMMVSTSIPRHDAGGSAIIYTSEDMREWEHRGYLYECDYIRYPEQGAHWECVVMLPISTKDGSQTKYILFDCPQYTVDGYTVECYYWIGTFDKNTCRFIADDDQPRLFDLGRGVYTGQNGFCFLTEEEIAAGKTYEDGRTILYAIAQGKDAGTAQNYTAGWAHNFAIPLELWLSDDGKDVIREPIKEIESLRTETLYSYSGTGKTADEINGEISTIRGDMLEIRAKIELDPTQKDNYSAGIFLRYNPNNVNNVTERTEIVFSNNGVFVERIQSSLLDYINRQPSRTWEHVKSEYEITILLDRSMLEVYVDGVISFTTRIYPKYGDSDYLQIFDNNANIKFTELQIYRMGSAYSDTVTPPYYGNMGNLGD
ncbi:MAG: GH32 C-terminal domain-containing protein [Clostridia bacterium]|nr:GH32 C-terminal domain-containing protein [Clostridia bacterium]